MTTVINLNELAKEPDVVIVTSDGERHAMKPATVQSFIDNVKMVESLGTNASVVEEMEVMIKIITGAFPTISEDEVRGWPLENLQSISDLARGQNGELVTTDEDKAKEAEKSGNA
ncbi:hypothetical protein PXK56_18015 [Phaeobacter gallaeciensis]|uniref:hypothetical protein n=1 Tax=Phaeobacter gallaeciensis TaxID=60890 RepID=UPI00237FE925|nr:hypothetical protein [Phaeobacter gallaeciensis]MDE4297086.1 hypothetical protein [Phaeobacter gallaeciensis]